MACNPLYYMRITSYFISASYLIVTSSALTQQEIAIFSTNVQIELKSDGNYEFISTGYPSHEINNSVNPNEATAQNFNYSIPSSPTTGGKHCTSLGPIGFAINGVAIYNALTGDTTDAVIHEIFDDCKGHSSPDGAYHYHQFSGCIAGSIEVEEQFLGVALDGHPIYGPKTADKTELLTSADLDACHGRMVNGVYRYHITEDFPYALGCYVSQPGSSNSNTGGNRPPGGNGPPGGNRPPRGKRQIDTSTVTCVNVEGEAQLCDCNNQATYKACDVAVRGGNCNDEATDRPTVENNHKPPTSTTAKNNVGSSTVDGNGGIDPVNDNERTITSYSNGSSSSICLVALVITATIASWLAL